MYNLSIIIIRLLDLNNSGNAQTCKLGSYVWLQSMPSHLYMRESSNSVAVLSDEPVVGSKLFGPPVMGQMKFYEPIENNVENLLTDLPTAKGSYLQPKVTQKKKKNSDADFLKNISMTDSVSGPGSQMFTQVGSTPISTATDGDIIRHDLTGDRTRNHAEICGVLKATTIHNSKSQEGIVEEKSSRYKSKEATYLARWRVMSASRNNTSFDDGFLKSQTPIFFEQDLYVLASSTGTLKILTTSIP